MALANANRIEVLDEVTPVRWSTSTQTCQFEPSPDRRGRVVVAISPNPDHVTTFHQTRGMTYYTPTWEWADLYCAR